MGQFSFNPPQSLPSLMKSLMVLTALGKNPLVRNQIGTSIKSQTDKQFRPVVPWSMLIEIYSFY